MDVKVKQVITGKRETSQLVQQVQVLQNHLLGAAKMGVISIMETENILGFILVAVYSIPQH